MLTPCGTGGDVSRAEGRHATSRILMDILTRFARSARLPFLFVAATFLPLSASAQPVLSVSPLSVTTEASAGLNAPSRTVQVSNTGTRALKWTVVQSSANWLSVSPNKGTNAVTLTLTFQTAALAVGQHQTTFRVESPNGAATVAVTANITGAAPPPTLTVTCPANITTASPDGNAVPVTFSASTSGGNPPVNVIYSPASGSNFSVGTTTVTATATSSDGQKATCGFSVTVTYTTPTGTSPDGATPPPAASIVDASGAIWTIAPDRRILRNNVQAANGVGDLILWKSGTIYVKNSSYPDANGSWWQWLGSSWSQVADPTGGSPPPPPSGVGPQSTITCPAGAVNIFPGSSINAAVDANVGATTFCLMAGTHNLDRSIIPKTGNTFVGEFGAI